MKPRTQVAAILSALLAACSSTSSGVSDPDLGQEALERQRLAAETKERFATPARLLLDLDKSIDKYVQYVMVGSSVKSDSTADKIAAFIREQATQHFDALVLESDAIGQPHDRAIAVAALGFTGRTEAFDPLMNAIRDDNQEVVTNAVLGLAILRDPRTPPEAFARIFEVDKFGDTTRTGAAWALYSLQQVVVDQGSIHEIWRRTLAGAIDGRPSGVTVQALRGIGFARDPADCAEVIRYVSHPTPMVRFAAAVALGRLANEDAVPSLLALISPAETNENVRLAARTALRDLAGGEDRKYDVEEWKSVFDRKS